MHTRVRLSFPSGEQDSSSSLSIRPLNSPQLPVELWDEIAKIISEDAVASTAQHLLNMMLSCRELCQIVTRHLYKFNERMIEVSQLSPWSYNESTNKHEPTTKWEERSAMQWAARNGLQRTAQAVMEITPELCEVRHVGIAIKHQHFELAWMLLEWEKIKTEVSAGVSGYSPIFAAVAMNHEELIEHIVKLQGLELDVFDFDSKTVLHHACENGHLDLVKRFLKEGADPMLKMVTIVHDGFTALDMAISHCPASARVDIVKEILSRKPALADPEVYIRIIAKYDRLDVLNIFIQEGIFETFLWEGDPEQLFENWLGTLHQMSNSIAIEAFSRILKLCPEEYFPDFVIDGILRSACQPSCRGNKSQTRCLTLKISKLLIDHVSMLRNNDLSSLTYEKLGCSIEQSIRDDEFLMVDYVLGILGPLKNGQLPSYQNRFDTTFFPSPYSSEMLSVLIEHGLDVNQTCGKMTGLTHSLHYVKYSRGMTGVIGVLKDMVPMIGDIDQQHPDDDDNTALMNWLCRPLPLPREEESDATEELCLVITKLLLDHGASLTSRNSGGDTPLHIATTDCYPSVVQLLIDHGADVNATDDRGETALHRATSERCWTPGVRWGDYGYPQVHCVQQHRRAVEKIVILINAGADPESISDSGTIALRPRPKAWECRHSLEKMVEIYTSSAQKRGDPVNVVNFLHRCPSLLRSCAFGMINTLFHTTENFDFLLGYGFDINEHNNEGENLLDISLEDIPATEEECWLFMYLLSKGAEINAMNQKGETVLDRTEDLSTRDLLIRHGALPGSLL